MAGARFIAKASLVIGGLVLFGSSSAFSQSRLNLVRPFALQRGTSTSVTFAGEKHADGYPLLCYTPGLTNSEWKPGKDAKRVSTSIHVPEDFPIGWHAIRFCGPGGLSNVRMIYVSDSKLVTESNTPHGLDSPQKIHKETLLEGRLREETRDCYAVELKEGDPLSIEIQALRIGLTLLDIQLSVVGPEGNAIVECDDASITRQDPYVRFVAPMSGTYNIVVSESRFEGKGNFWYLLHTGNFPRPAVASPLGGLPGDEMTVTWINGDGSTFEQQVAMPIEPQDEYPVFPQLQQKVAPSPALFRVSEIPTATETEPNENFKTPNDVVLPVAIHGVISKPRDHDHYRFEGKKGQVVQVRVYARNPGRSPLDAIMNIRHAGGKFITSNDDANGITDSMMRVTLPKDGKYVVMLRDQRYRGGDAFVYRMEIGSPKPQFTLDSPDVVYNQTAVVHVSQGNRMAALVTVQRKDIEGPLDLELSNLPTGLSVDHAQLPAARNRMPVLFSAEPDAELGGHLLPVTGIIRHEDVPISGNLQLRQLLVRGRNNREMWGVTLDRLGTAIMPKSPVTIELATPQVPLVRSGTMDLRITATRDEGFEAPVTLKSLYDPTGVSSRDRVTIAKGASEGTLTLTANGKASIGEWPIVVLGETTHKGNRFQFSTSICPLSIAASFFELEFPQANIERGGTTQFPVKVTHKISYDEVAAAQLVGLPAGVTAEPIELKHGVNVLDFELSASDKAKLGRFDGINCRVTILRNEEPITHILGAGKLRVDQPLENKVTSRDG